MRTTTRYRFPSPEIVASVRFLTHANRVRMPREQFLYGETQALFQQMEDLCQHSGVSRGQAFEDFLTTTTCALAGGTMEDEYLGVAKRYADGSRGERGIDRMARMFGCLIECMEQTRRDILGDLFQGAITYGEAGQYLTPETVCDLIARMTGPGGHNVLDPCCGSGRMLLAAADVDRSREFIGQDIDLRCVRITAINLALRNLYGYALWGDSLGDTVKRAFRTGFNGRGFIADVPCAAVPLPINEAAALPHRTTGGEVAAPHAEAAKRQSQLRLF